MKRYGIKKAKKLGEPPGLVEESLEISSIETKIELINFNSKEYIDNKITEIDNIFPLIKKNYINWIDIVGQPSIELLNTLMGYFKFHPMIIEDITTTDESPVMEDHEAYLFIVMHFLKFHFEQNEISKEQINIFLGENFALSIQEGNNDLFNVIKKRISEDRGRIRKMGADYLVYSLMDYVVDNYLEVVNKIGEKIEVLEEELEANPTIETQKNIHKLRRELTLFRRSIWPARSVIGKLENLETSLISKPIQIFLRDLSNNLTQVYDSIELFRDMLISMLDIYLSIVNNRMNEIMKLLTVISTIFIPLTFIVGIYGMNFSYMPELKWIYGYPIVWIVMIIIGVAMVIFFKRRKWL